MNAKENGNYCLWSRMPQRHCTLAASRLYWQMRAGFPLSLQLSLLNNPFDHSSVQSHYTCGQAKLSHDFFGRIRTAVIKKSLEKISRFTAWRLPSRRSWKIKVRSGFERLTRRLLEYRLTFASCHCSSIRHQGQRQQISDQAQQVEQIPLRRRQQAIISW